MTAGEQCLDCDKFTMFPTGETHVLSAKARFPIYQCAECYARCWGFVIPDAGPMRDGIDKMMAQD